MNRGRRGRIENVLAEELASGVVGEFSIVLVCLQIIKDAQTATNDSFVVPGRVGKSQARRKIVVVRLDVAGAAHPAHLRRHKLPAGKIEIGQPVMVLHHRRKQVVANTEVQSQLRTHAEIIHGVEAGLQPIHSVLAFLAVTERRDWKAQQETGERTATRLRIQIPCVLLVEVQVATRILGLEKSMPPPPKVAAKLPRMPPPDVSEGVHQLIVVLPQELGEPVRRSQRAVVRDADVRKASRRNRIVRVKNPRDSNLLGDGLAHQVRQRVDHIAGITQLEFVDLIGGKSPDVTDPRGQRHIRHMPGERPTSRQAGKRVGTVGVDLPVAEVHGKAVVARGLVIDSDIEGILIVPGHRVGEKVVGRAIQIWGRKKLHDVERGTIQAVGRNHIDLPVVRDRISNQHGVAPGTSEAVRSRGVKHRARVELRVARTSRPSSLIAWRKQVAGEQVGEIPAPFSALLRTQRNRGDVGLRLPDPRPLVIGKEEQLVLDHRTAECGAELVLLERHDRRGGIVEIVLGVERRVAQEFVDTAVKLVAAGLQQDVDDRSAAPDVGPEIVGLYLEFLDGINRGLNHLNADLLFVVIEAVEQEVVVRRGQAVGLDRTRAALVLRNSTLLDRPGRPRIHSRR